MDQEVGLRPSQQQEPKPARLSVYRLTSDDGIDIGVMATSKTEARRRYEAEICGPDYFVDYPIEVTRIPANREVRISWIDDKPDESDVPEGGRLEAIPDFPQYLSVVATAKQWCAFYSKHGRDFQPMWEAE